MDISPRQEFESTIKDFADRNHLRLRINAIHGADSLELIRFKNRLEKRLIFTIIGTSVTVHLNTGTFPLNAQAMLALRDIIPGFPYLGNTISEPLPSISLASPFDNSNLQIALNRLC